MLKIDINKEDEIKESLEQLLNTLKDYNRVLDRLKNENIIENLDYKQKLSLYKEIKESYGLVRKIEEKLNYLERYMD